MTSPTARRVAAALDADAAERHRHHLWVGDFTAAEIKAIQNVVNEAGRPLEVVGSQHEELEPRPVISTTSFHRQSLKYFEGLLEGQLPGLDPDHGIIPGVGNPKYAQSRRQGERDAEPDPHR